MTIGPLFFAAPWALAVLAALPVLWLILKAAPPAPNRLVFPPLRLLLGLKTAEETTGRPPWWLLALRALAAALLIIGFSRPSLAPDTPDAAGLGGPMLIAIDDGWPSAPAFDEMRATASGLIARAERAGQSVTLLTTAAGRAVDRGPIDARPAAEARALIARLEPKPWRPDRKAAAARVMATDQRFAEVHWLTDAIDDADAAGFAQALAARGPVTARRPARLATALISAEATARGVEAVVRRASVIGGDGAIAAETLDGRPLGAVDFTFAPGALQATVLLALPAEIAARAARVRIVGERSAGAVWLLPSAAGRPIVGLADPGGQGQPLLSELYYVDRAIEPFAQTRRGGVETLIADGAQAIVLPDASRLAPPEQRAVERWLDGGGLLIRFAGPRLANDSDALLPTPLRRGARQLGGALGWETPQPLRPFESDSPFYGLPSNAEVTVNRHVMGAGEPPADARVWARLADGAPIVTAASRGRGMVVLFHVGAGPEWSSLPLTGLYVDMLRRVTAFAGRQPGRSDAPIAVSGPYVLRRMIDGYGAWAPPPPDAPPVAAEMFDAARASPTSPPGLYERGAVSAAVAALRKDESFESLPDLPDVTMSSMTTAPPRPLSGWFLSLAALLMAIDVLVALWLAGRLPNIRMPRWAKRGAAGAAVLVSALVLSPPPAAHAQSARAGDTDVRLAYVITGDAAADATARAGLDMLAKILRDRTAVEPGPTVGVDLARDDLSRFAMLYWLAPRTPRPLSDSAASRLDRYMRLGGMVFLDTRDAGAAANPGPAATLLRGLDAPPLEPVGADHVLTKAYYLMQSFPGRTDSTRIFAETPSSAAARDGVPALLIGNGDWASAWAQFQREDSLAWFDDDARRREMAVRFGVNLVMVSLTGNYKADQVHVPALLERMGVEERRR